MACDPRVNDQLEEGLVGAMRRSLFHAYQPIVNVHTGESFGFEALVRGVEQIGFASIDALFTAIAGHGLTLLAERVLLESAVRRFAPFADGAPVRLFFNLNNPVLDVSPNHLDLVRSILAEHRLPQRNLCLELSEATGLDSGHAKRILAWRDRPLIAIDDFGMGHSGLRILAESKPDVVKIDRFFIAGVEHSQERRTFLTQIVNLAHATGLLVVAEGVETEGEFRVCRACGCDYVQGYVIARPIAEIDRLAMHYPIVEEMNRRNRREGSDRHGADLRAELDTPEPLSIASRMETVLDAFRQNRDRSFFPVVSLRNEPLGIVHEERLKALIYSQFGRDLLTNRVQPHRIQNYLTPCLVFDVSTGIDRILSAIAQRPNDHAVLIAEDGKYVGLLDTSGVIRTMHERMLTMARDENPLTKLPGNMMVANYMADKIDDAVRPLAFVHFDFDYFKPFNDRFGFRVGDRAISMFSALMRNRITAPDTFLGHLGGDDFFVGVSGDSVERVVADLPDFVEQFRSDAESFYDPETRRAGCVEILDRSGDARTVPLLSVSCACLILTDPSFEVTLDAVSARLAHLKAMAKRAPSRLAFERIQCEAVV